MVCGGEQMAEGQADISEAVIHQVQRLLKKYDREVLKAHEDNLPFL